MKQPQRGPWEKEDSLTFRTLRILLKPAKPITLYFIMNYQQISHWHIQFALRIVYLASYLDTTPQSIFSSLSSLSKRNPIANVFHARIKIYSTSSALFSCPLCIAPRLEFLAHWSLPSKLQAKWIL